MSFTPVFAVDMAQRPIEVVKGNRFEKTAKERGELYTAKAKHRKELQQYYGRDWKRHLNITANPKP